MGPSGKRAKDAQKVKSSGKSGKGSKTKPTKKDTRLAQKDSGSQRNTAASDSKDASLALESKVLPITLQQLLLNVFRFGLWSDREADATPLSELIQTLKAHLYRRDFISAFADANSDLLNAYTLRWSAGRALGYAGIFGGVFDMLLRQWSETPAEAGHRIHAFCIGGGAGAEIVALAAAWRLVRDGIWGNLTSPAPDHTSKIGDDNAGELEDALSVLSVTQPQRSGDTEQEKSNRTTRGDDRPAANYPLDLRITAVDIANWSSLVDKLSTSIASKSIPSSKSSPAPLVAEGDGDNRFHVSFKQADILSLADEELRSLLESSASRAAKPASEVNDKSSSKTPDETVLVTLMFTLNELFSASIPKTTAFLLRLTELLRPGTILLVVDSPGSYSTVSLGGNKPKAQTDETESASPQPSGDEPKNQRKYPMRFLLDYALLTTAAGEWECILSDESRWFRRDATKLSYEAGDGIGLEDMRFQIHVYRRLAS
ncbi:hypothetical protein AJ80_06122 [Polytolypa hystricis UAMH7299]|uniref:25S rRNA (Uridine(2843)-N(3))-methyltransferase n=1 Tax=Polytolypa hystricis (strain UAMH7299) TaxID=1447883 RepID=A0A2B7XZC7_POLH7|nr:hypothetical protein AJ80_06122 [Polytolypa hystricis UAMH7299]